MAGQKQLFVDGSEESEAEDDDDTSDVEMISAQASSHEDDGSEAGTDDNSEEMLEGAEDEELDRLNTALGEIVGTRPAGSNDAAEGEVSSSEEAMDDEAMFALDDQMAQVFKERRKVTSRKQEKRDAKETVTSFKNRVLDIFIKLQHSKPAALGLMLPLLKLGRKTTNKQTSNRCRGMVRDLSQKCKGKTMISWPAAASDLTLWRTLDRALDEAHQDASRAHATACSQASLVCVKMLVFRDVASVQDVVDRYSAVHKDWLQGRITVHPTLLSDFLNWSASYSKQTRPV